MATTREAESEMTHVTLSYLREALIDCGSMLASGEEPVIYSFPHEPWKEREMWLAKQEEHAGATDEIVRQFAEHFRWPRTTKIVRYYLGLRVRFAIEYLRRMPRAENNAPMCICINPNIPILEVSAVVEWLLIDVWHDLGISESARQYERNLR
jgi:hypothetical protein